MEKKEDVKIDKIVLNVDGTKIPLTTEQAKKIKDILADLFGGKEVVKEHHWHEWYQRPFYYHHYESPWKNNIVYCSNNTMELSVS